MHNTLQETIIPGYEPDSSYVGRLCAAHRRETRRRRTAPWALAALALCLGVTPGKAAEAIDPSDPFVQGALLGLFVVARDTCGLRVHPHIMAIGKYRLTAAERSGTLQEMADGMNTTVASAAREVARLETATPRAGRTAFCQDLIPRVLAIESGTVGAGRAD